MDGVERKNEDLYKYSGHNAETKDEILRMASKNGRKPIDLSVSCRLRSNHEVNGGGQEGRIRG